MENPDLFPNIRQNSEETRYSMNTLNYKKQKQLKEVKAIIVPAGLFYPESRIQYRVSAIIYE
jgi:hypothetical protein